MAIFFSDITDHLPNFFIIKYSAGQGNRTKTRPKIRLYSKSNKAKFIKEVEAIKWEEIYTTNDANTAYELFINKIVQIHNKCFQLIRLSRRGSKDKLWFTEGLKKCCREKNRLYRKWIKKKNSDDHNKYKDYQRVYKQVVKSAETDYYKDQFQASANNSKKLWQNLNKLCSFTKKGEKTKHKY